MKKLIAFGLALMILASTAINVMAAPGAFLSSPTGKPEPVVVSVKCQAPECTASLVITAYGDRHELSDAARDLIEKAYKDIANAKDISEIHSAIAQLAALKNIDTKYLAASNLFDISPVGCNHHDGHHNFDIVLTAEALHNVFGLLHMKSDGTWEFVDNATVGADGKTLTFTVDSLSPFAIVVDTTGDTPQTGDTAIIIYSVIMISAAAALVFVIIKRKNQVEA